MVKEVALDLSCLLNCLRVRVRVSLLVFSSSLYNVDRSIPVIFKKDL